ncbi:MAG TPA: 30S ribosomal protein S2 [Candidatus Nanoarchaeia archaeon]|nr:30S ribosomal protein S2 [Candidatus Nanoarchaeia archaeon]
MEATDVQGDLLLPLDEYLKVGLHIGTKFRTKDMQSFIYKVRPDSLSVLNVQKINERLSLASKMMSNYEPNEILIVCRRENGWQSVELFSRLTGIKVIVGRYPPGLLTNTNLEDFTEVKLIFVVDPLPDKNAVEDALRIGLPVIALCDTNNEISGLELAVPCNNKGRKSLGLVFWVLAREYLKSKGLVKYDKDMEISLEQFCAD